LQAVNGNDHDFNNYVGLIDKKKRKLGICYYIPEEIWYTYGGAIFRGCQKHWGVPISLRNLAWGWQILGGQIPYDTGLQPERW